MQNVEYKCELRDPALGTLILRRLGASSRLEAVAVALKKGNMLRKPSVSVEVTLYRPIYVLGEVNKPGQYPYQPGMTVDLCRA